MSLSPTVRDPRGAGFAALPRRALRALPATNDLPASPCRVKCTNESLWRHCNVSPFDFLTLIYPFLS